MSRSPTHRRSIPTQRTRARIASRPREIDEPWTRRMLATLQENQRLLRELAAGSRPSRVHDQAHVQTTCTRWDGPTIRSPQDVWDLLGDEMSELAQEQLRVLLLDTKHRVLRCELVYQGTVDTIAVRSAELLRPAVLENAPMILLAHNHPSGDPTPSAEDVCATEHVMAAGELLDIEVLDHIVLGKEGRYVSLRQRGLITAAPHSQTARAA